MKSSDIVLQLMKYLPAQTNLFCDEVSVTSLVKSSGTVTCTTTTVHGLSSGDYVYIKGAQRRTLVSALTRSGTIATATTSSPHDLTETWHTTVEIVGATQADYNGVKALLSANNRNTFTFTVANAPTTPATGTIYLLEPWREGFNGWYQVTVTSTTTFTYTSADSFSDSAYGTIKVRKLPRVGGALTIERAQATYTKQGQNKLWAFLVLGPVTASTDRFNLGDAIAAHTGGSSFRQTLLNEIDIYVFVPTRDTLSGRAERDLITDVSVNLYKALVGKTYPTYLTEDPVTTLNFLRHQFFMWDNSYYVHQFKFEGTSQLTKSDIVAPDVTRAFRDLVLNLKNVDFGVKILATNTKLDDDAG